MTNFFKKLFLVKEIRSKTGELHFQRYRVFACKFFSIYLHFIAKSDEDKHPHSHPWNFFSLVLWGGYAETLTTHKTNIVSHHARSILSCSHRFYDDYHKIVLVKPTWTLVFVSPNKDDYDWGYLVNGCHVRHENYRIMKNEGLLDNAV
jgi:hypothetical protein